jgi:hypothetical protein
MKPIKPSIGFIIATVGVSYVVENLGTLEESQPQHMEPIRRPIGFTVANCESLTVSLKTMGRWRKVSLKTGIKSTQRALLFQYQQQQTASSHLHSHPFTHTLPLQTSQPASPP